MHIDDATSNDDRLNKAIAMDFCLSEDIPTPGEINESREFIRNAGPVKLRTFRDTQLRRVAKYVDIARGAPTHLGQRGPPEIVPATGKMQSVDISAILNNYDIWSTSLATQFTCGFPWVGDLSQEGVPPRDTSRDPFQPTHRGGQAELPCPLQTTLRSIRPPARRFLLRCGH